MKVKFTLALLLGTLVIFTSSARATTIRTGSSYGTTTIIGSSAIATQWSVCLPGDPSECDLLVQINGPADLDQPIQITLNNTLATGGGFLNGEDGTASPAFGLMDCVNSVNTNLGKFGGGTGPCAAFATAAPPTQDLGCDVSTITDVSGTFTIPAGTCLDGTDTFYFDIQPVTNPDGSQSAPVVNAATIGPVANAPEPSSLALLGIGLFSLALISRRRLQLNS